MPIARTWRHRDRPRRGVATLRVQSFGWLSLLLLLAWPAQAGEPLPWMGGAFEAPAKDVLAASQRLAWGAGGSEVLLEDVTFVFDDRGRHTRTTRLLVRLRTEQAAQGWSTISAAWNPWYQQRPELRARVIGADGSEHWLEPSMLSEAADEDRHADQFYEDKVLRGPLPAIGEGSILESVQVIREKAPLFAEGVVRSFILGHFNAHTPARATRIHVDAPVEMPLRTALRGFAAPSRRTTLGNRQHVDVDLGPLPAVWDSEPLQSHDVPPRPLFTLSTGESWSTVAAAYSRVVDAQIARLSNESVKSWVGDAHGRETTARKVLDRLHEQVRYSGLEMGEGAIVPRSPDETLSRKFGDCKDMSALLVAMLRRAGIPASVAVLRVGLGDVASDLPGLGEFNHAIAYVPGAPPLWIDPTDPDAIVGELPTPDQGRFVLIASPETTELTLTPVASAVSNRLVSTHEFFLSESGPGRVVETQEAEGVEAEELRRLFRTKEESGVRTREESRLKSAFGIESLGRFFCTGASGYEEPFRLTVEGIHASQLQATGREKSFDLRFSTLLDRLPWSLRIGQDGNDAGAARRTDLELPEQYSEELRFVMRPPEGYALQPLPELTPFDLGPFKVERGLGVDPTGAVTVTFHVDVNKRHLSPSEFRELRIALKQAGSEVLHVVFENVAEALMRAGRVREALAEHDRLVAEHPTSFRQAKRARALLAAGAGGSARAAAAEAVRLDRSSPEAQRTLGWVWQHDLVGRRYGPGFDLSTASAAYSRALLARPDDLDMRAEFAALLEHDAQGGYWTSRARLSGALDQYRSLHERSSGHLHEDKLVALLLHLDRFDELISLAATLEPRVDNRAAVLAATTIVRGIDSTKEDARKLIGDPVERSDALAKAAREVMFRRHYALAASLYELAEEGAPHGEALLESARDARRMQRFETLPLPKDDPTAVVQRLFTSLDRTEAGSVFSDRVAVETRREALETLSRAVRAWLPTGHEADWSVAVDRLLATSEVRWEGDHGAGFRIVFHCKQFPRLSGKPFFVVEENGEYRVLATGDMLHELGGEALRRVASGDLSAARRWLGWAGEIRSLKADPSWREVWPGSKPLDGAAMRLAAAVVLANSEGASEALPILQEARAKRADGESDPVLSTALVAACWDAQRGDELVALAADTSANLAPDDRYLRQDRALRVRDASDERLKAAEARLRDAPEDERAVLAVVVLSAKLGDFERAEQVGRTFLKRGRESAVLSNDLAWYALCRGQVTEQALSDARDGAPVAKGASLLPLTTLAAVYAERGRALEAREVLDKVAAGRTDGISAKEWFVYGRIFEEYGLTADAIAAYERVETSTGRDADAPGTLAEKRLRVLKGRGAQSASQSE
jgi:tetratricopeptide (TPR) repeat protein